MHGSGGRRRGVRWLSGRAPRGACVRRPAPRCALVGRPGALVCVGRATGAAVCVGWAAGRRGVRGSGTVVQRDIGVKDYSVITTWCLDKGPALFMVELTLRSAVTNLEDLHMLASHRRLAMGDMGSTRVGGLLRLRGSLRPSVALKGSETPSVPSWYPSWPPVDSRPTGLYHVDDV